MKAAPKAHVSVFIVTEMAIKVVLFQCSLFEGILSCQKKLEAICFQCKPCFVSVSCLFPLSLQPAIKAVQMYPTFVNLKLQKIQKTRGVKRKIYLHYGRGMQHNQISNCFKLLSIIEKKWYVCHQNLLLLVSVRKRTTQIQSHIILLQKLRPRAFTADIFLLSSDKVLKFQRNRLRLSSQLNKLRACKLQQSVFYV